MADLQEELQRFLEARFGADVKDAFVSCIRKIHAENLVVADMESSLRASAAELRTAKDDLVKEIESAKEIGRAANSNATAAMATASNARDEASVAISDAEQAILASQQVLTAYQTLELLLADKVDGAFVENGYLYLTGNNEVLAGPLGPFSGTGGSGGSSGNNAVLTVANASGWLSKTIAHGSTCPVSISWASTEDDIPTGNGVMKLTVNGVVKGLFDITQGVVTKDIASSDIFQSRDILQHT